MTALEVLLSAHKQVEQNKKREKKMLLSLHTCMTDLFKGYKRQPVYIERQNCSVVVDARGSDENLNMFESTIWVTISI